MWVMISYTELDEEWGQVMRLRLLRCLINLRLQIGGERIICRVDTGDYLIVPNCVQLYRITLLILIGAEEAHNFRVASRIAVALCRV